MQHEAPGVEPGDVMETVQLGLCVGGAIRLWGGSDAAGSSGRLWRVDDPDRLRSHLGVGEVARTLREERRFREVGLLAVDRGVLMLPARMTAEDGGETQAQFFEVGPLADASALSWNAEEVFAALAAAVSYGLANGEFLLAELGGWDAPTEPFVLNVVLNGQSHVQAEPPPRGSELWAPHIQEGAPGASVIGPVNASTPNAVAHFMLQAISTWGVAPWDVALTFGRFE